MKLRKILAGMALVATLCMPARAFDSREELRAARDALGQWQGVSVYAQEPSVRAPYAAGALDEKLLDDALAYLNYLRAVAGLAPVTRSKLYDARCQHGAALLAALDYADHNAPRPDDMDADFYDTAHTATSSSNLAKFNWMRPSILREGLEYFVRDDGDANLAVLGHRQWLLNPKMAETGFGLANSESGMSYVLMYAHDMGNAGAQWETVFWPAEGAFPVELMHANLAWSVTLNAGEYDLVHSDVRVTLSEETRGLSFQFNCTAGTGDGFCAVSDAGYGAGPCVIFRPDFTGTDFTDYEQNQRWTVRVEGLRRQSGETASLVYTTEMVSITPQKTVNVEITPLEARLAAGQTLRMEALVVPQYADDLSVRWSSTDAGVAAVDGDGLVTAVAPGECEIIVQTADGCEDRCRLTVGA